jgi:hypothetical protein
MIKNSASSLVNSLPSTEAEDQAAMAAARGRAGGGNIPTPPVPPAGGGGRWWQYICCSWRNWHDTSSWPVWQQILAGAATGLGFVGGSRLGKKGGAVEPGVGETGLPDVRLSLNRPEIAGSPAQIGSEAGTVRLGGTAAESSVPGLAQPRLLPSAATPQLSGPDAQFQHGGGPEVPKQLTAPPNDTRPVADPNTAIPAQRPAAPEVIPLSNSPAAPQVTDSVPAIDQVSPRAKGRTRASRARVTPRI